MSYSAISVGNDFEDEVAEDGSPIEPAEWKPDDRHVLTYDQLQRLAAIEFKAGDRIIADEDEMIGPVLIPKGIMGSIIKGEGGKGVAENRRGAVVLWDERPQDQLGRGSPGLNAYEGHAIVKRSGVRKEPFVATLVWAQKAESCQWPTTPIRIDKEVEATNNGSKMPPATVKIVPGLRGRKSISLEIALRPQHYICICEDRKIRIKLRDLKVKDKIERMDFDESASWTLIKREKGLYVAFESVWKPGWIICASDGDGTIRAVPFRHGQAFKDMTTMAVLNNGVAVHRKHIEQVEAFVVGDEAVGVRWSPSVGPVRIWSRTPQHEDWNELQTTTGHGCAAIVTGIDVVAAPHLFLVAPLDWRHFFQIALEPGQNLIGLVGGCTTPDWVTHHGLDTSNPSFRRRTAMTGEEVQKGSPVKSPSKALRHGVGHG